MFPSAFAQFETLPDASPAVDNPLLLSPLPSPLRDAAIDVRDLEMQIPPEPVAYEAVPMALLLDFLGLVRVVALIAVVILFLYLLYFFFCFWRRLRHEKAEAEAQKKNASDSPEGEDIIKLMPLTEGLDAAELSAVVHEQHQNLQEQTVVKEILSSTPSPSDQAGLTNKNERTPPPPTDGLT